MSALLGSGKTLEEQWKKVFKARSPKRGTSEMLRDLDNGIAAKSYDRHFLMQKLASQKDGPQHFAKSLEVHKVKLQHHQHAFHDWLPAESTFLQKLISELGHEHDEWLKSIEHRG